MVDASLRATILESLRQLHDEFGISLHLHHPRPDHRLPDQPERHRALSRPGRRGGRRRGGGRRAEASLHAASDRLDPASRSRSPLAGRGPAGRGERRRLGSRLPLRRPLSRSDADVPSRPCRRSTGPDRIARRPATSTATARSCAARTWARCWSAASAPSTPRQRRRAARGRDQTRRLRRGLAISSRPIEIRNSEMNRMPTTMIGASHHHHQPLMTAPVKLTQ